MLPRRMLLLAATASALLAFVVAECPNGCSGNGDCMAKDMCNCYNNFQGNDCSERTCLFSYAHVDTPRGDLNMDQNRMSVGPAPTTGWILTDSQQAPAGTYEYFHPAAADHEAHFYLECASKGIYDRASGLCTCFDGYEGNGCARTTCPNKCNGHGTCHSIRQLGEKAAGTLFGTESPPGSMDYDLWDANSTYGCRCDPWYTGADCSRRTCKVGVDPLYLAAGTPTLETFVIHAYDTAASATITGSLRLRLFDYYGEAYITEPISFAGAAGDADANAEAVTAAIKAVPNLTFRDVHCEAVASANIGASLSGFLSTRIDGPTSGTAALGMSVVCQYIDNPGKMRIPDVVSVSITGTAATTATTYAFVVTTSNQGRDDDWFPVQTTAVLDTATPAGTTTWPAADISASTIAADISIGTGPMLVKLGPHIVLAAGTSATTPTSAADLELVYALPHSLSSPDAIVFKADSASDLAVTAVGQALTVDVAVGDTSMIFGTTDPNLVTGDLIFFENQFFTVQQVYLDGSSNFVVNLDKPFGGNAADGGVGAIATAVYEVTRPDSTTVYNYVSQCSGRGLCSFETGLCTCFKGYTNDNCNTQNILAL